MQAHHECIRYWERDQSVCKCIHAHIMCNRSWMEIATFDYREHVVLKEMESSCHFPRHDRHFYDCMTMINTILTLAGIPRRTCSQSIDTGTT